MSKFHDKNFGKHPDDPDYDHNFDRDAEYERFLEEQERKEEARKGN